MVLSNCAKIAVSALLAGAAFSNAANIIQDDFSTNPSNPNSVGWYSSSAGFSTFSAASGGLQFTSNTATTNQSVFKQFTPTSLAVGEIMTLSMQVTAMSSVPNSSAMWRIGLFDTGSTFSSNQGSSPWATTDEGYMLAVSTALDDGGGTLQSNVYYRTGNANIVTTSSAASVAVLNDRMPTLGVTPLTMSLSVERLSATQVKVTGYWLENGVLGGTLASNVLNSDTNYVDTFDTIYFGYGAGGDGRTFTIDDVTLSIVPEPSHALLSLCGIGFLAIRRRR